MTFVSGKVHKTHQLDETIVQMFHPMKTMNCELLSPPTCNAINMLVPLIYQSSNLLLHVAK